MGIPIIATMVVFAAGVAMFVAAVQVYFQDLTSFLYMLRIWLYLSPILWVAAQVPERYKPLLYLNPHPPLTALSEAVNFGVTPPARRLLLLSLRLGRRSSRHRGPLLHLEGARVCCPPLATKRPRLPSGPRLQRTGPSRSSTSCLPTRRRSRRSRRSRRRVVRLGRRQRIVREIEAVRDVTFDVPHGAVLGIIGVNGAGKSTLMRTVAGILPPTSGRIEVHGRVSTLLALGVGFKGDLSGRENVVLGGLAAGLTRDQLAEKYDEIAEFAELGDFMDMPMRTYSSGMYGRLAFSVAINMEPDILLIDEASVGDARFREKSFAKMRELCSSSSTILLVSHGLNAIRKLADEVIWLHQGEIAMQGEATEVIQAYKRFLDVRESDIADDDV